MKTTPFVFNHGKLRGEGLSLSQARDIRDLYLLEQYSHEWKTGSNPYLEYYKEPASSSVDDGIVTIAFKSSDLSRIEEFRTRLNAQFGLEEPT